MAQDLIETWQSVALEDPEYGKRRSYFSILTVLVELKKYVSIQHVLHSRNYIIIPALVHHP